MKLPQVSLRDLISERLKFRVEPPHFRFEKDFNFYLNSSRVASSGEFKFKP
jgi:hypothetical protein